MSSHDRWVSRPIAYKQRTWLNGFCGFCKNKEFERDISLEELLKRKKARTRSGRGGQRRHTATEVRSEVAMRPIRVTLSLVRVMDGALAEREPRALRLPPALQEALFTAQQRHSCARLDQSVVP